MANTSSETLKALKDAITAERTTATEKYDTQLAQVGALESTIESEKEAYGEQIRKDTLALIDDVDGEGKIYTEADMQALKDENKAMLDQKDAELEEAAAAKAKAEAATKTADAKADRFKQKFEGQRDAYKSAQERENALKAEVAAAGQDDEEVEEFPTTEVSRG